VDEWPTVSVIVPTRYRPGMLERALESVLVQRYEGDIECLVVFDQSEASTPEIRVPPGREIRTLLNTRAPGVAGARNSGLLAARGDLIAFCDDDDEWLPGKLRLQVEALVRNRNALATLSGIMLTSGSRTFTRIPDQGLFTQDDLLASRQQVLHSSGLVAWREAALEKVGLFDENIPSGYGEDYDWLLRATVHSPLVVVREPLVRVNWGASWFADHWSTITSALQYQLQKHPELRRNRRNLARMQGRIAFGYAALNRRAEARLWAGRCLASDWREPRGYLALLAAFRVLPPNTAIRLAHALGRGI
jgi:glycosyltransferase involved in cell wall biosynthesis